MSLHPIADNLTSEHNLVGVGLVANTLPLPHKNHGFDLHLLLQLTEILKHIVGRDTTHQLLPSIPKTKNIPAFLDIFTLQKDMATILIHPQAHRAPGIEVDTNPFDLHIVSQAVVRPAPHKHLDLIWDFQLPDMFPIKLDCAITSVGPRTGSIPALFRLLIMTPTL